MSDKPAQKETSLVPIANTSITTRSSGLVRRGLEDLVSKQVGIVRFPPDRSIGIFRLSDHDASSVIMRALLVFDKKSVSEARGNIIMPPGKRLFLKIDPEASTDLSYLTNLMPDDIYSLDLGWTQVSDTGLASIQALNGLKVLSLASTQIRDAGLENVRSLSMLREVDLHGTPISDIGLESLERLTRLCKLDLSNTLITDAGVSHLKRLSSLESLNVQNTRISNAAVSSLQKALPNCSIDK